MNGTVTGNEQVEMFLFQWKENGHLFSTDVGMFDAMQK